MISEIVPDYQSNVDALFDEWDKDRDQALNLEETMSLLISVANSII
jgi:hypothetical protein